MEIMTHSIQICHFWLNSFESELLSTDFIAHNNMNKIKMRKKEEENVAANYHLSIS